jgi:DNA polymerase-3 subunit beta
MKISTLQENLKQGLFVVSHIAKKSVNLPILNNIMIDARDGNIKLIATNLEVGVVNTIRGKVEKEGSFTVDSKTISDYVSLLPNKKINIEQKENNLIIEAENYKTKIIGQSAEEFPLIPEVDKKIYYSANINEFKQALAQTIFAVSTNESRLELSGVLFNFNKDKLTLAATDSYRLAEKIISIKTNSETNEDKKTIIPARTLQELVRILSGEQDKEGVEDSGEIKFYLSENQILFTVGSTELVSRLIEGQYPDYKQIIPVNPKTTTTINRAELIRAVKASALFSKAGINDINLDFPQEKNKAVISSASGQTGENMTELNADITGEDNGVVINYRYLLDGLNNIEGENVKIEVIDSNTPCILRPEKGDDYLYIIMPIKQ